MLTKVYKILNTKTGLYSTGGSTPTFKKNGKTWTMLSHLKSHITMIRQLSGYLKAPYYQWPYTDCVIEEYTTTVTDSIPIEQ